MVIAFNHKSSTYCGTLYSWPQEASVVDLLEAIASVVIAPVHEDRAVEDAGAMLAVALQPHMGLGQLAWTGPTRPTEVALGAIGADPHGEGAAAISVASALAAPQRSCWSL